MKNQRVGDKHVESASYHRNGVAGRGFMVAVFHDTVDGVDRRMLAVHFPPSEDVDGNVVDDDVATAVVDLDLAHEGNVEFAENSWRGDHWHDWMKQVGEAWSAHMDAQLGLTSDHA
ncbi:MAG TPA: hypothetical protein VIG24_12715 [Acidimicrobiia bacterium]